MISLAFYNKQQYGIIKQMVNVYNEKIYDNKCVTIENNIEDCKPFRLDENGPIHDKVCTLKFKVSDTSNYNDISMELLSHLFTFINCFLLKYGYYSKFNSWDFDSFKNRTYVRHYLTDEESIEFNEFKSVMKLSDYYGSNQNEIYIYYIKHVS